MADWQKGDLALCIVGGIITQRGCIYTVRDVLSPNSLRKTDTGRMFRRVRGGISLLFDEFEDRGVSAEASRFRKVTPPKADQFDREVIDLMAGKKVPA